MKEAALCVCVWLNNFKYLWKSLYEVSAAEGKREREKESWQSFWRKQVAAAEKLSYSFHSQEKHPGLE
jgi:hypothetical protein